MTMYATLLSAFRTTVWFYDMTGCYGLMKHLTCKKSSIMRPVAVPCVELLWFFEACTTHMLTIEALGIALITCPDGSLDMARSALACDTGPVSRVRVKTGTE
jgi:hypothetical protein